MSARYAVCLGLVFSSCLGLTGCRQRQPIHSSGPATVEELVSRFEAATRSNDVESIASIIAPPADELLRARFKSIREVREAVSGLTKECNFRFGPNASQTPLAFESPLADIILNRSFPDRPPGQPDSIRIEIVRQETLANGKIQLSVKEQLEIEGETNTREETMTAIKTNDGWKLEVPAEPAGPILFDKEQQLADYIRLITEEVHDDQFRTREEVDFLMAREFVRFLPDVLSDAEFDSTLKADALRLGLSTANRSSDEFSYPYPELQVVIPGESPGDPMRFSAGDEMVDTLPEEVQGRIEHAVQQLGLPAGFRVLVTVRKGADKELLMSMLHTMLDLRTIDLRPDIIFSIESTDDFEPVVNRFTGRLRLLSLKQPEYEDRFRPDLQSPPEEMQIDKELLLPEGTDFNLEFSEDLLESIRLPRSDNTIQAEQGKE